MNIGRANIAKTAIEIQRDDLRSELAVAKARPRELQQELDANRAENNKLQHEGNAAQAEARQFRSLYDTAEDSRRTAVASLEKEKADHQTALAGLADPADPSHLLAKLRRLETEDAEIPNLRTHAAQWERDRTALISLRKETAEFEKEFQDADALAERNSRVEKTNANRKLGNDQLKATLSEPGATKLKDDLSQANERVTELEQDIKTLKRAWPKDVVTRLLGPVTGTDTTNIDDDDGVFPSDVEIEQQASHLGLETFQLSPDSFVQETVRLLRYLKSLHSIFKTRMEAIKGERGGLGWDPYPKLENLLKFCRAETARASRLVLKLDRGIEMESEGLAALSLNTKHQVVGNRQA